MFKICYDLFKWTLAAGTKLFLLRFVLHFGAANLRPWSWLSSAAVWCTETLGPCVTHSQLPWPFHNCISLLLSFRDKTSYHDTKKKDMVTVQIISILVSIKICIFKKKIFFALLSWKWIAFTNPADDLQAWTHGALWASRWGHDLTWRSLCCASTCSIDKDKLGLCSQKIHLLPAF